MQKNITIQIWTDLYYCRVIGLWYPPAPEPTSIKKQIKTYPSNALPEGDTVVGRPDKVVGALPEPTITTVTEEVPAEYNDAPFMVVLSSMYKPRNEVHGGNPVAPGQHPIPKDFLEKQIRHISYLFANEFGIFQPETKALAQTFIAKQTISYKKIKELKMNVSPATGSMSLKELRDSIDQYTDEEQHKIQVITVGEHPLDAAEKDIKKYIHTGKNIGDEIPRYITITKLTPVYTTNDPYIKKTSLPEVPADQSIAPGTEEVEISKEILNQTEMAIAEDDSNREALKTFDTMSTPKPQLDEDGEPVVGEDGEPVMIIETPDRVAVLEQMLKDKNKLLEDLNLKEPTIPVDNTIIPEPQSSAEMFPYTQEEPQKGI